MHYERFFYSDLRVHELLVFLLFDQAD